MRYLTAFICASAFSLFFFASEGSAQGSTYDLTPEQMSEGKLLREEYAGEKEDLEIQLQKLIKDRDIAVKDKNTSLVEKRNREIKQTREKINKLPAEYDNRFSEMLTDEQKENKVTDDFYKSELDAELAKMKDSEAKEKAASDTAKTGTKSGSKKSSAKKK